MSATALPITSARFAAALRELPISALHAKASELQNAIAHLEASNKDLEEYVRDEDDKDCYEALMENKEVIERNRERIELIRKEVTELRGLPWTEGDVKMATTATRDGDAAVQNGSAGTGDVAPRDTAGTTANGTGQEQEPNNGTSPSEAEEGVFL